MQTTCPACQGSGQIVREKCADCSGSGTQMQSSKLEVKVPPGVDNGMQLCLRGEGEAGPMADPLATCMSIFRSNRIRFFERHEKNLSCRVPVAFASGFRNRDRNPLA